MGTALWQKYSIIFNRVCLVVSLDKTLMILASPWCLSIPQVSLERHPRVKITAFDRDSWVYWWAHGQTELWTNQLLMTLLVMINSAKSHVGGICMDMLISSERERSAYVRLPLWVHSLASWTGKCELLLGCRHCNSYCSMPEYRSELPKNCHW